MVAIAKVACGHQGLIADLQAVVIFLI